MTNTATIESFNDIEVSENSDGGIINSFKKVASKAGALAYDFAKANPILTGLTLDFAITGGALTQKALVGAVETIGGAAINVVSNAGTGLMDMIF
jgi:hypothetical protein